MRLASRYCFSLLSVPPRPRVKHRSGRIRTRNPFTRARCASCHEAGVRARPNRDGLPV